MPVHPYLGNIKAAIGRAARLCRNNSVTYIQQLYKSCTERDRERQREGQRETEGDRKRQREKERQRDQGRQRKTARDRQRKKVNEAEREK